MRCEVCGLGPSEHGTTVYRQNPLGGRGRWACEVHSTVEIDPETQRLVDVLEDPTEEDDDE
jgi:hypothetical protein